MTGNSSAIAQDRSPLSTPSGLLWGLAGVVAFSFTMPMTRVAVDGAGMSPVFVGSARAVVAAAIAAVALAATRQTLPQGAQWFRLLVVAAGVVVGFPMLTSLALTHASASHGAVVIALLPAATAVVAVFRGREQPGRSFWMMSTLGAVVAVVFAIVHGGGGGAVGPTDLLFFGAVVAAAVGYAEGGLLSRELGPWQTVSWALVVSAPLMVGFTAATVVRRPPEGSATEWGAFAYLALVSMYLGFFAWYRGLAIGPMAQVSQVQLTQPGMTIAWAAIFLGERVTLLTVAGGLAVMLCAALAVRSRMGMPVVRTREKDEKETVERLVSTGTKDAR